MQMFVKGAAMMMAFFSFRSSYMFDNERKTDARVHVSSKSYIQRALYPICREPYIQRALYTESLLYTEPDIHYIGCPLSSI